jgi:hypothetical protein
MGDILRLAPLLLVTACGHADERIDTCLDLCPHLIECGEYATDAECDTGCHVLVRSEACLAAIAGAECAEMGATDDVCYPACTAEQHCVDDVLVECVVGREYQVRCRELCNSEGLDYSGTCGKELEGEPALDVDVCWCIEWQ